MFRDPVGAGVGIGIEVAFLIGQIAGQKVAHPFVYVQLTGHSHLNQAIAVALGTGEWRQRVLGAMDDAGGRCRRADSSTGE